MADEVVYTGTAPDTNTGDPLRLAFTKVNAAHVTEVAARTAADTLERTERLAADALLAQQMSSIAASFNIRTWAAGQTYSPGTIGSLTDRRDVVLVAGVWYIAAVDHEAGAVFADDLAAGRWIATDPVQLAGDLLSAGTNKGAELVSGVDVQLADYTALRSYAGNKTRVYITGALGGSAPSGIAGVFVHRAGDTTSADNGGTIIVDGTGRRWHREFSGNFKMKWWGAIGAGIDDESAKIQLAVDVVEAAVIASGFTVSGVLEFQAGRYVLTTAVYIPPFLKIKSAGLVIFETDIVGTGAAMVFRTTAATYASEAIISKQMWMRGPFLNGADGGIIFENTGPRTGNTALEIGPSSDLGPYRPIARYSASDVAIRNYEAAMKFNRSHNYIAHFTRFHIESNTNCCVFGESGVNVTNSGENISFSDSVFAGAENGFYWFVDGFDVNFSNCSFDFIGTVFRLARLYKKITVTGGHIEGIGGSLAHDGIGGIVLEESTNVADNGTRANVYIDGVAVFVNHRPLFRGGNRLVVHCKFEDRITSQANSLRTTPSCESAVTVQNYNATHQARYVVPSLSINHARNATLAGAAPGASAISTPPTGFTQINGGAITAVYDSDSPFSGYQSIAVQSTAASYYNITSTAKIPIRAGQVANVLPAIKVASGAISSINIAAQLAFYDANDVLVLATPESLSGTFNLSSLGLVAGQWVFPYFCRSAVAPLNASYVTFRVGLSGSGLIGNTTKFAVPFLHVLG